MTRSYVNSRLRFDEDPSWHWLAAQGAIVIVRPWPRCLLLRTGRLDEGLEHGSVLLLGLGVSREQRRHALSISAAACQIERGHDEQHDDRCQRQIAEEREAAITLARTLLPISLEGGQCRAECLAHGPVKGARLFPVAKQQSEPVAWIHGRHVVYRAIGERVSSLGARRALRELIVELVQSRHAANGEREVRREHVVPHQLARGEARISFVEPARCEI